MTKEEINEFLTVMALGEILGRPRRVFDDPKDKEQEELEFIQDSDPGDEA